MREEALLFGEGRSLVGIITDPPAQAACEDAPAVVLLNQGMIHRVGPNRLYVKIARRLADAGFVVLRFDFSGIGDSPPSADNLPFKGRSVTETRGAMDCLAERRGCKRFILMGICSGAVGSFNTACNDSRVVGAVQINPQFYNRELSSYVEARRGRYWRSVLRSPRRWLRPLTGKANYRMLWMRLRGLFVPSSRASSAAEGVGEEYRLLTEKGVSLLLIYSSRDWGLEYFDLIRGTVVDELIASGKLRVETIRNTDHSFIPLDSQDELFGVIESWAHEQAQTAVEARL